MLRALFALTLFFGLVGMSQTAMADEVLLNGLAWRQFTDTAGAGLSWNDVASVCPLDETPCQGTVKGVDFSGWIWASQERVGKLLEMLTGLTVPVSTSFESSVELLFDKLDPVFESESGSAKYAFGLTALPEIPADALVDAIRMQDTTVNADSDYLSFQEIGINDTETSSFFGPLPLAVFLVRDPAIEICDNGIDDNGNGQVDLDDSECVAANPVVNELEWRQLTSTQGVSYLDVAAICPPGNAPCSGFAGGIDFTGWTWAYSGEVQDLVVALTGERIPLSASRFPYDSNIVPPFFAKFQPTFSSADFRVLYGFTYDSTWEVNRHSYPDNESNNPAGAASCFNGLDDDVDGDIDFADTACNTGNLNLVQLVDSHVDTIPDVIDSPLLTGQNSYYGHFLHRPPKFVTRESCNNTFDDDGDGLVDEADEEDCGFQRVGLAVQCIHDPVYLENGGEVVNIKAQAIDSNGQAVVVDTLNIWLGFDKNAPQLSVSNTTEGMLEYPPADDFSYLCEAKLGSESFVTEWRKVAVGRPDPGWPAIPVLYNGAVENKIDIVFFADQDDYSSPTDPAFIEDVGLLIQGGYLTVPWFARWQKYFNFWIATEFANSGPDPSDTDHTGEISCLREAPKRYKRKYSFADSSAIVHREVCRDNAGWPGVFTIETDLNRLQVIAHETAHRPFGLADEYCCDGGYHTRDVFGPPFPNLFKTENGCRNKAEERGYDPDACRSIIDQDTNKDWWLFEPNALTPNPDDRDILQGTGCETLDNSAWCRQIEATQSGADADPNGVYACAFQLDTYLGDPDGIANNSDDTYWVCRSSGDVSTAVWASVGATFDRYSRGDSESDRFFWYLSECTAGRC